MQTLQMFYYPMNVISSGTFQIWDPHQTIEMTIFLY